MRIVSITSVAAIVASVVATGTVRAQEAIPVEREPTHQTVFRNRYLQVFRVRLAPGQTSLMHTHSHDDVAVRLRAATTTSQSPGQPEGAAESVVPGMVSARNNERSPTTHRVHNVGTTPFDVMDVQALERPEGPEAAAITTAAAENPRMRAYRYDLEPGASSARHVHTRPYLRVAATAISLATAGADGRSRRDRLEVGAFRWVEGNETHTLINAGKERGIVVELELK